MTANAPNPDSRTELADLRARLAEAEETLRAIRGGEVDALVIGGKQGDEVHLLGAGDRIYRQFLEAVSEGTATVSADGEILSCNAVLAETLRLPLDQVLGTAMLDHLSPDDHEAFRAGLADAGLESRRHKIRLKSSEGRLVPVYLSATLLHGTGAAPISCLVFTDLQEVVSAEEALRESEERHRAILQTAMDGFWLAEGEGRLLEVNETYCRMSGYSAEELRAMRISDLVVGKTAPEIAARIRKIMAQGQGRFESRHRRKDGSVFDVEISVQYRPAEGGRLVVFLRDITNRKRAEDALRESQQLLEGIVNAIPVRVFWKDRDLVFLGCNAVFARDAGFADPKDVIGKNDFEMAWGEQADLYRNDDRQVIESGESKLMIEEAQTTPNGETITLLTSKLPLRDAAGEIIGVLGTYIDITQRKRMEAERQRLSVAIEAAGETVLVTDAKGTIQYVNPVFEAVTGYSRAEAIGKSTRILGSGEHDGARFREAMDTFSSGRVWRGRLVNSRKDGSLFTVDTTISPVRDEAGRIVNYVCVERDVSEQLRLAEEKSRLEDQLRQAQKIEAVGRLAGGVAHDFNNLTAIVLGYGEMLLERLRPDDPARQWAGQIVEAGKRSAALTRQLLAFSRKQTLQPEVLDLNALLRNLEKMLVRLIGEDIGLEFRLAADLGRVTADPGQIEQVVTNLVLNARDAMPRGGKLTLETADVELDRTYALSHASVVPGKYVMLALTDVGCGMDKETLAHLFEPFFTTKEKGKGTGLGLATAFGIVKQSGGYLYAYSEPDQGTTFKIYLPWTNAAPTVKAAETAGELPRGSGERILLVEDEASLRELCATVLSGLGYRVNTAANGAEALLQAEERGFVPDLVLSDVVMPGMSGPDLADRLREGRPEMKVLYMSGYPDEAIARHGVLGLGNSFLQKPFSERALAVKVRQALGEKAAAPHPVRRVLMIDDDAQFRDLVRHFCAKRGHVFAGVGDAAAAIAALAGQPCDVLLVDLNIPGTSGGQVLRELRAAGHAAPAIVLTGDVASADMDQLRPLGVVRALEKSSDTGPLLRAIEEPGLAGGEKTMRSGEHGG